MKKGKRGGGRGSGYAEKVLEILKGGEKSGTEISKHLGTEQISVLMGKLLKDKKVKFQKEGVKKIWSLA